MPDLSYDLDLSYGMHPNTKKKVLWYDAILDILNAAHRDGWVY